jgi:hypothetical protein
LRAETEYDRVTPFFQWPTGEVIGHTQFDPAIFFAPFLAISFCHCKNVDILREPLPAKVKAKRERLHGWSASAWHSLKIEPMRKQLAKAGLTSAADSSARCTNARSFQKLPGRAWVVRQDPRHVVVGLPPDGFDA